MFIAFITSPLFYIQYHVSLKEENFINIVVRYAVYLSY
jgi:hypothetical protein